MIKISVIVPVYNVEKYLEDCIQSLVSQTLEEKEVIFINDGSTDNSLKILEDYQIKNDFIKIINQENQGQSVARNKGIDLAKGKYIIFVDSDDWIEKDALQKLYNFINNTDYDFLNFPITNYNILTKKKEKKEYGFNEDLEGKMILQNYFKRFIITASMNKVIKTSILKENNIKYPEDLIYEDLIFNLKLCMHSNKTKYIDYSFYNYRLTPVSTTRKISIKNIEHMQKILELGNEIIKNNFQSENLNLYETFKLYHYLYLNIEILRNKNLKLKEKIELLKYLYLKENAKWELKYAKELPKKYKQIFGSIFILRKILGRN